MTKLCRWLMLAVGVLALSRPATARADIVDFDPTTDPVPAILPPEDLATIDALMSADFPYAITRPNPRGSKILIHRKSGYAVLDLNSGDLTSVKGQIQGEIAYHGWLSDHELGLLLVPSGFAATQAITQGLTTLTIDTDTGEATPRSALVLPSRVVGVIGVSQDFRQLLVADFDGPTPPIARTVTLGRSPYWIKPDGLPDNLPGRVGESPFGPMSLFDAPITLRLVDFGFRRWHTLVPLPADSGVNPRSVSWSPDGTMVSVTTMTLPGWAGDRVRGENPQPGPSLDEDSINVREALGQVDPAENPLRNNTNLYVFMTATGDKKVEIPNSRFSFGVMTGLVFGPPGGGSAIPIAYATPVEGRPFRVYSFPMDLYCAVLDEAFNLLTLAVNGDGSSFDFLGDGRLLYANSRYPQAQIKTLRPGAAFKTLYSSSDMLVQAIVSGDRILFSIQNFDKPTDFWIGEITTSGFDTRRLTTLSPRAERASRLRWREVLWETTDGWYLSGMFVYPDWMLYPPPSPAPLIVWQEGGPDTQMTHMFGVSSERPVTILANLGLPVFLANGAGRRSRGQQFFSYLADAENFGQLDIIQIKEGVDELIRRRIVAAKSVGISGCSYGGYFALQSISTFRDYYAAANAQCSLVDLEDEFENGDSSTISFLEGTEPAINADEYQRDSPLFNTKSVSTPTLLFHGMQDFLPVSLVAREHNQIESNGTPVRLIRFIGEMHGLVNPRSQSRAIQESVDFFRVWLHPLPQSSERQTVTEVYLPSTWK